MKSRDTVLSMTKPPTKPPSELDKFLAATKKILAAPKKPVRQTAKAGK
jgi:hypothetical protein